MRPSPPLFCFTVLAIGALLAGCATPLMRAARDGDDARAMIEDFLAAGMAALLLHGPDMRIAYDQTRYAAIRPDDIATAFRYERSQDAEELRRLGAVGESFRPLTRAEAEELLAKEEGAPQPDIRSEKL